MVSPIVRPVVGTIVVRTILGIGTTMMAGMANTPIMSAL
jgi:hypothetical protein